MSLNLLPKKSWNVYNAANIERVRRDEAAAQARDEAEEQRMQEEDAARRIALLRGEAPPPLKGRQPAIVESAGADRQDRDRDRKSRRLRGEDDTDRDIRCARQDAASASEAATVSLRDQQHRDAPLQDDAGHVQLFVAPDEAAVRRAEKKAGENAKKRKAYEDDYCVRFSDASGYGNNVKDAPWYHSSHDRPEGKYVWGNEAPLRREREQKRLSSADPLAMMQQAQKQLQQSKRDREAYNTQKQLEVEELDREERAKKRKREREKRYHREAEDSLDGFNLDESAAAGDRDKDRKHRRHREHRHHDHHKHHHHGEHHRRHRREHHDSRSDGKDG